MAGTLTAIRSLVSTIFAPGVPEVLKEFHTDNSSLASLMVSIYVMGSAVGPLILTPITEMSGRLPVTHGANILFMIAAIVCASSINISMLIVSRLIMGIASSVPVTVGGGFVADMMPMERRGTAMTIWTVGPLLVRITNHWSVLCLMLLTLTIGLCNRSYIRRLHGGECGMAMDCVA